MIQATPGQLALRILDQNSGAEVIGDLPHPHQSSWTVTAIQKGMPGSAGIGPFKIPLFPPNSSEYKAAKPLYDLLADGQRVEAYVGDVVTGTPRYSGVITARDKSFNSYQISGSDSLYWLLQSQVLPGEVVRGVGALGKDVVPQFATGIEVVFDDRMSGTLANYTQTPAGQWTAGTDPYLGNAAFISSVTATEAYLVGNTSYAAASYQESYLTATFFVIGGTDATNAGEATLLLASDATGANCVFARANIRNVGGKAVIDGEIWTRAASVNTRQLQKQAVATFSGNAARIQLTVSCYYQGSLTWLHLFVNGADCGTYLYSNGTGAPSGRIGLRWFSAAGGTPTGYAESISWRRRSPTPRFTMGTLTAGNQTWDGGTHYNGQTNLDLIALACGVDGYFLRKTPGAGLRADILDYGPSPGTDLSGQVVFEEGINLEDAAVGANADSYGLDLRAYGTPGSDTAGIVTIPASGNAGDLSLLDSVATPGAYSFLNLLQFAGQIQGNKSTPGQAKTAVVRRDPQTADVWRELDTVTLHAPTLDIHRQKVLVLGYTFTEGSDTMTVVFDQYNRAFGAAVQNPRRLMDAARQISSTFNTR